MEKPDLRVMMTTFTDNEAAFDTVKVLLEERLIACGTVLPGARSLYRWKGGIEEASEVIVLLKTDQEHATSCEKRLEEIHPYKVPAIVTFIPESLPDAYASWAREALRNPE
jgi:periplasmic divalent cation tolerance protein